MIKFLILFTQIFLCLAENLITFSEFRKAVTDNVYPAPTREQYDTIINMALTAGNITSKEELAMFLSQVLWESGGLQHKKEIKCASNQCPSDYRTGREQPGKYYYGRGYIQLTWLYNYEQCSKDLYGDNRLVENPDIVSDTEKGAWGSAFWYWAKHCHKAEGVADGHFGASTMAINGVLECKGPYKTKAFKRFTIYVKVLKAFNLNHIKPNPDGCYPMTGPEKVDFRLCESTGAHKNSVGMYHWCNDNCNAEDPNCPEDMCACEGGNPKPKPKATKNQTQSEPQLEIKPIKVEDIRPLITNRIPFRQNRFRSESQSEQNSVPKIEPKPDLIQDSQPIVNPDLPKTDTDIDIKPVVLNRVSPRIHSRRRPQSDPISVSNPDPTIDVTPEPKPTVSTERSKAEAIQELRKFIFQYNEPMRLTTQRPDLNRTQLLRNELGRLIRKRPVVRNGPQNQQ